MLFLVTVTYSNVEGSASAPILPATSFDDAIRVVVDPRIFNNHITLGFNFSANGDGFSVYRMDYDRLYHAEYFNNKLNGPLVFKSYIRFEGVDGFRWHQEWFNTFGLKPAIEKLITSIERENEDLEESEKIHLISPDDPTD